MNQRNDLFARFPILDPSLGVDVPDYLVDAAVDGTLPPDAEEEVLARCGDRVQRQVQVEQRWLEEIFGPEDDHPGQSASLRRPGRTAPTRRTAGRRVTQAPRQWTPRSLHALSSETTRVLGGLEVGSTIQVQLPSNDPDAYVLVMRDVGDGPHVAFPDRPGRWCLARAFKDGLVEISIDEPPGRHRFLVVLLPTRLAPLDWDDPASSTWAAVDAAVNDGTLDVHETSVDVRE